MHNYFTKKNIFTNFFFLEFSAPRAALSLQNLKQIFKNICKYRKKYKNNIYRIHRQRKVTMYTQHRYICVHVLVALEKSSCASNTENEKKISCQNLITSFLLLIARFEKLQICIDNSYQVQHRSPHSNETRTLQVQCK